MISAEISAKRAPDEENAPQGAHSLQIGEFRALRQPKVAVVETAGDGDDRPGDKIGVGSTRSGPPGDVPAGSRSADGIAVIPFRGRFDGRLLVGIANVPGLIMLTVIPWVLFLRQVRVKETNPALAAA